MSTQMPESDSGYKHRFGFGWGPAEVTRCAALERSNGIYRVVNITTTAHKSIDIYVSPTGRSIRVFSDEGEWKP